MQYLSGTDIGTFVVSCYSAGSHAAVKEALTRQGFHYFELDGHDVTEKASLFGSMAAAFSLSRFAGPNYSWDAMADALWQVLMDIKENRAALVWSHADKLLRGRLQLLLDAIHVLLGLAETIQRQENDENCHPLILRVVLLGEGENFQPFI